MNKSLERADDSSPQHEDHDLVVAENAEPSWFFSAANHQTREDLMLRYRSARNLPDPSERPAEPERYGQPRYRQLISASQLPSNFMDVEGRGKTLAPRKPAKASERGLSLLSTFILAATMASLTGGTIGFIAARFGSSDEQTMLLATDEVARPERVDLGALQQQPRETSSVQKKNVATARLKVADVSGETNSLIPLSLQAEPAFAGQDLLLKISGLPENAYLTSGRRQVDKVWTLTPYDIKDVKVMIPQASEREIDLAVGAFEPGSGELAAPIQDMKIELSNVMVEPVSAPPPSVGGVASIPKPNGAGVTQTASKQMAQASLQKGDRLFRSGDVAAARQAYQVAWNNGSPDGALGLARSYDPVILSSMQMAGSTPDRSQALQWYERAAIAGNTQALSAIVRLRLKPN